MLDPTLGWMARRFRAREWGGRVGAPSTRWRIEVGADAARIFAHGRTAVLPLDARLPIHEAAEGQHELRLALGRRGVIVAVIDVDDSVQKMAVFLTEEW